jgi:hypothetical protein
VKVRLLLFSTVAFLVALFSIPFSASAQRDSCVLPTAALASPLYHPGPCRVFRGTTIANDSGVTYVVPQGNEMIPNAAVVNGTRRGDSVVWFSGNWTAGHADSRLTQTASSSVYICAGVKDFRADNGQNATSTSWTCANRRLANDPVLSTDVSQYSGCATVFFPGSKVVSMTSDHAFDAFGFNSTATVNYRCTLL